MLLPLKSTNAKLQPVIPITGPRSLMVLLSLSAVLWSVGCRHDARAAAKEPRGARKAPVESEAERLKEIDQIGPTAVHDRAARANLRRALHDPSDSVRRQAASWLSKSGYEAIPILVTTLSDTNTNARLEAAYALGLMGASAGGGAGAQPAAEETATPWRTWRTGHWGRSGARAKGG